MAEQQLNPEQVLAQLQTRGFETGGFRSPLRYFRGRLDSITGSMVQRGQMPQARLEVNYNFSEIEVFQSTEPYPFPIAQISILHSNREKSLSGVLGQSIDKIINAGIDENTPQSRVKNQDFLIGRIQEWKVTPGHKMPERDEQSKWTETDREAWEVTWIDGVGGTPYSGAGIVSTPVAPQPATTTETPIQAALRLLENKTLAEWHQVVFQEPSVKADTSNLKVQIISNQFLPPLEAAGIVSKDDNGRYHIKKD